MNQITLGESLLFIVGMGLVAGLSYWLGRMNGRLAVRKVGEFKHQDILMTDDGPIIVMRPTSVVPYRGEMITVDELCARGKIEGVYPIESYIGFGEATRNEN